MLYRRDPAEWVARETCGPGKQTGNLSAGQIVVWERRPYRVVEVAPRLLVDWKPEYLKAWEEAGRPDPETWRKRPIVVVLAPEFASRDEEHLEAPASYQWPVLPEHFAVCRLCLEIPPCQHEWEESVLRHARVAMAEVMQILPGACHACKELIRPRQGTVRFEGENLIRPDLGDGSAVFHTRRQCWSTAVRYDEKWVAAEPGRKGKLHCAGRAVHHFDGSLECSLGIECVGPLDASGGQLQHRGGEVWHSAGRGCADDCWCTSGKKQPASIAAADDKTLF